MSRRAKERGRSASVEELIVSAQILQAWGDAFSQRGDWAGAEEHYRQAMVEIERRNPESFMAAKNLNALCRALRSENDLDSAEKYCRQGMTIAGRLGSDTLTVAQSLNNLGLIAMDRGDLDAAWEAFSQSLAIREKLSPVSLDVAESLHNLGLLARDKGDLAAAEQYTSQALSTRQQLAPGSMLVAYSLNNLGLVFLNRGDLVKADQYFREALSLKETLTPGSINLVTTLNNIGLIAKDRGDLDEADTYHKRALSIAEKAVPGGLQVAGSLSDLADVAEDRGDLGQAEKYYREALAIAQRLVPDSLSVAYSLKSLGLNARDRGELVEAEQYQRSALSIFEKLSPEGIYTADAFFNLGEFARQRGDPVAAEGYYREALKRWQKLAPENMEYAESLAGLAETMRGKQQLNSAAQLFGEAIRILDTQMDRLGGSGEIRAGFRSRHASYYSDYIDVLMLQKQPELALQLLERSRARTLLEMLAEAKVDIRKGVEPSLLDRERLLQATFRAKSNRRIDLREKSAPQEQLSKLDKEIDDLLVQYNEVENEIRAKSPNYTALTQPAPLSVKEVQEQLLDADTVLLEYSLGEERSYVFALTSTSLSAHELPNRSVIESLAHRAYDSLTSENPWTSGESTLQRKQRLETEQSEFRQTSAALGQIVLGPVAAQLGRKRLLIVGDGALQYLPFGVLPVPDEPTIREGSALKQRVPLIAEHEIVNLPSASALAILRRQRKRLDSEPRKVVAVLADPVFDKRDARVTMAMNQAQGKGAGGSAETVAMRTRLSRSMEDVGLRARQGESLPRLLFSRREAMAIVSLAPAGEGFEALDFQASRETAMSTDLAQYRILHFATHGLLDNKHPELSGLVFSLVTPEGESREGFLDLHDVYNLSLRADLVVLSACETALGKEVSGEGLLGLTRGFMYAGATRVVASLWKVDDAATEDLMARFYKAMLQQGLRPAAALRQAQEEMREQRHWSSPYYWGAFVLQGDWN